MDVDLEAMRSFGKFRSCVECLLEPLLKKRRLVGMPCKHKRTFQDQTEARRRYYDERGLDDPGDHADEDIAYCDCIPFDRRNELWQLGDLCVKYTLTRTQMRELAAVVLLVTPDGRFTYNHVRRAMHDNFAGRYKDYLKAYARKRDEGISFQETVDGLVPRWQFRMMPNA